MDIKEFYNGCKVCKVGNHKLLGTVVELIGGRAIVRWEDGGESLICLCDLEPVLTPKQKAGKLIAHWNRPATKADIDAVRSMVQNAIDSCGLDAAATVEVYDNYNPRTLGYNPIKAEIKIRNPYPAIRMANGTVVKGMDTITVLFCRKAGLYDFEAAGERQKVEAGLFASNTKEAAMAAVDGLPWDGEVVDFSARTNGKARDYRKRHWYPFEGGTAGYGAAHIGGHFGYADKWDSLSEDFSAYIRNVANSLGYAGKAWRKEVA